MRVLLAGLFHETHTFLSGRTELADFAERVGDAMFAARGDGSPMGGMLEVAAERRWRVIPAIDLRASPSPTCSDTVVERFWSVFESTARAALPEGLDGILLVLHGAMVSASHPDVEGVLLARIRQLVGPTIPIAGVLDLHGNISQITCDLSQGFVAYRENPHADACAAAMDGARLLDRLMTRGETAHTVWVQPPVMWPPTGTGTATDPMRALEAMARDIERQHPEILAVNVFGGFSFADTPATGVAFTACTVGDPDVARRQLQRLADEAIARREQGNLLDAEWETLLPQIRQQLNSPADQRGGPLVIAEPSDNIGGGAPGDSTHILRWLIRDGLQGCLLAINDPETAQRLHGQPIGTRCRVELGGRSGPLSGGALACEVELRSATDGRFLLEDRNSHLASMSGDRYDMGPSVHVRVAGNDVVVTSRKTPPFDLAQWRVMGLTPERVGVIFVKAAVAHRRVYEPIASGHARLATPGPCASDLRTLPFRHIRRPVYPLDQ